jgi:hypothetical protein
MPAATDVLNYDELFRRLRAQGFDVSRRKNHTIVVTKDSFTKTIHPSALRRFGGDPRTLGKIVEDLRKGGFEPAQEASGHDERLARHRNQEKIEIGPRLDVEAPIITEEGETAKYRVLPVADLVIGSSYQRLVNEAHVKGIARNFNLLAFGSIIVSEREDGELVVIDGQHRVLAVKSLHWDEQGRRVPALVVKGLSEEAEANLFVGLNTARALRPFDIYKARLIAGDVVALALEDTAKRHGLSITVTADPKGRPDRTAAVAILYQAEGAGTLDRILTILERAWGEQPYSRSGAMIRALHVMLTVHEWAAWVDDERLIKVLGKIGPVRMGQMATEAVRSGLFGTNSNRPKAIVRILFDRYNEGLAVSRQLVSGPEKPGRKMSGAA